MIKKIAFKVLLFIGLLASSAFNCFGQLDAERVFTIGKNALYFEDYILSIQYFNQVIKSRPYMAEPYFFRGLAKFYLEDYKGAEADCSLTIERNPFLVDAYEVRALSRLSTGDYAGAVADYDKGLKYLPENKFFLLNKAIAQQNLKDYDNSKQTFDKLLSLFPKYDNAYLGRAQLNVMMKDTVAAYEDLNKCISLNENNVGAYLMRADIEMSKNKDYPKAIADMDRAIKLEPKKADLFVNRAFLRYKVDDYFGAMSDFDYAIGLDPGNVPAHFNRALLKMEVGDVNKAIEDFSFALSREPENYQALYNRGVLYQDIKEYQKSIADFDKVLEAYPYLPMVYFARSESKRLMGDMAGGERDYNKMRKMQKEQELKRHAIADNAGKNDGEKEEETPEDVIKKFQSLVVVKNENAVKPEYDNKYRGKVQNYEFAIEIEGLYILSYYDKPTELRENAFYQKEIDELNSSYYLRDKLYITNVNSQLSERDIETQFELIRHYTSLLGNDSKRAVDYFGRGLSFMLVKDYDAAISDFTDAIALSPNFVLAYFARANARYFEMMADGMAGDNGGQEKEAKRLLEQAALQSVVADFDKVVELSPKLIYAYFNKGNLYYNQNDYTAAISCYTSAISIKPDFGQAYYNRGIAYLRMGNMDKGVADLSRAGELGIVSSYNVLKRMRGRLN